MSPSDRFSGSVEYELPVRGEISVRKRNKEHGDDGLGMDVTGCTMAWLCGAAAGSEDKKEAPCERAGASNTAGPQTFARC